MTTHPPAARRRARSPEHFPKTSAAAIRALLEQQWRAQVDEISSTTVRLYDLNASLLLDADDGATDVERELLERLLVAARTGLAETEAALERLADGSYGRCEACGEPIAAERLEVIPEARMCTACQAASRANRR